MLVSSFLPSLFSLDLFLFFFVYLLLPPRSLHFSLDFNLPFSLQSFLTFSFLLISSFLPSSIISFCLSFPSFSFTTPSSVFPFLEPSGHCSLVCGRAVTVYCFVSAGEILAHSSASSSFQKAVKSRFIQIRVGDDTLSGRDQSS